MTAFVSAAVLSAHPTWLTLSNSTFPFHTLLLEMAFSVMEHFFLLPLSRVSLYWAGKWILRPWATCTCNQCQICVLLWSGRLFSYIRILQKEQEVLILHPRGKCFSFVLDCQQLHSSVQLFVFWLGCPWPGLSNFIPPTVLVHLLKYWRHRSFLIFHHELVLDSSLKT